MTPRELMKVSPSLAVAQSLAGAFQGATVKRRPLLVDDFLASKFVKLIDKRRQERVRERLRECKKFVLDATAIRYCAEMMKAHPEAIARDQEFAIPQFPQMYIEYPTEPLFATFGQPMVPAPYSDTDVGYFFDGPRVYVLCRREDEGAGIMTLCYRLNRPFDHAEEQEECERMGISRMGLDLFYWGSLYSEAAPADIERRGFMTIKIDKHGMPVGMGGDILKEDATGSDVSRSLRAMHSHEWLLPPEVLDDEMRRGLLTSGAGDLRNIIALILFLNRTRDVRIDEEIPHHRAMINRRPGVLLRHSVVRIKLDPRPLFIRAYSEPSAPRREHDVRGHFCHDKESRAARHHLHWIGYDQPREAIRYHEPDWSEVGVNLWRCLICGGRRWHRKAHKRGSKEQGFVVTNYDVVK